VRVGGDDRGWAERAPGQWGLEKLRIGYGQSIANMREWGLFVANSIRDSEPAQFGEPYLMLVDGADVILG